MTTSPDTPADTAPAAPTATPLLVPSVDPPATLPVALPPRPPDPPGLPAGRPVHLAGRGTTWIHEVPGPPGAPVVVLLHGWTATAGLNWLPAFTALGGRYRVVAIDHRGHGRGIRTTARFRLADCADDVAHLLGHLGIGRAIAVGYSMGGPIAQLLWHRHRGLVDGLVLCATAAAFNTTRSEQAFFSALGGLSLLARAAPTQLRSGIGQRMLVGRFDDTDLGRWAVREVARHDHRLVVEAGRSIGRYNALDWLGGVDVPTAVLLTGRDRVVPVPRQRQLAAAIPHATVHELDGDHTVCAARPRRFVAGLHAAIGDVAARHGAAPPGGG